jgi:hypothetical protein
MRSRVVDNREQSMFREGQIAVVHSEESPNHGAVVRILAPHGWNSSEDKPFDPEWRDARLLTGPRAGRTGSIRVEHLKVYLNA